MNVPSGWTKSKKSQDLHEFRRSSPNGTMTILQAKNKQQEPLTHVIVCAPNLDLGNIPSNVDSMAILLVLQLQPNDESLSLHRKLQPAHGMVVTLEKARELSTEGHSFMDSIPVEETKQRGALGAVPIISTQLF
jgi:hypothetical protein